MTISTPIAPTHVALPLFKAHARRIAGPWWIDATNPLGQRLGRWDRIKDCRLAEDGSFEVTIEGERVEQVGRRVVARGGGVMRLEPDTLAYVEAKEWVGP